MKNKLKLFLAVAFAISMTFVSCKKTDTQTDNTELSVHADDQATVSGEIDGIADDANNVIGETGAFSGRPGPINNDLICNGVAVLDSIAGNRTITITYNGLNCQGTRIRSGVVVLSIPLGVHWRDAGAVLTINVQNLSITRVRDNKRIIINGTKTITNVTGGLIRDLSSLGTITHLISSQGITVTFDNGTSRSWQIARRRVFTYDNGIVITITGMHTMDGITRISEWGTNRFGNPFVTSITEPMIIRQGCNFRLVHGQVTHKTLGADVVVTFGLDATGNPTSCPGAAGTYYFKVVWTGANGIVRTVILPY